MLITTDGQVHSIGDIKSEVSIQSISKVFTLARVMQESGEEKISETFGVDATGQPFNSIVAMHEYDERCANDGGLLALAHGHCGLTT